MSGTKRHFSGRPVAAEESSSSDSEAESTAGEEIKSQKVVSIKPIQISQPKRVLEERPKTDKANNEVNEREKEKEDEISEEESSSEDSETTDSSSEEEQVMMKPVFLAKSARQSTVLGKDAKQDKTKAERTLQTIEANIQRERESRLEESKSEYGGIDDTDGVDPEAELREWEEREEKRKQRDRAQLEHAEEERATGTGENEHTQQEVGQEGGNKPKGVFFADEELLQRNLEGENEKYDRSLLPQRYNMDRGL